MSHYEGDQPVIELDTTVDISTGVNPKIFVVNAAGTVTEYTATITDTTKLQYTYTTPLVKVTTDSQEQWCAYGYVEVSSRPFFGDPYEFYVKEVGC